MIKIYSLSDPITGEIRYVGKTNQSLDRRLNAHISEVRRGYCRTHKINWIKSLMNNNLLPTIDILEIATKDNWKKLEIYWISQLKSWGFNLTNMTDGGDGNNNQMFSKESTIKRSKSLIGHIVTEETRRKISRKQVGKKLRQETKDKLRLHNLGKRHEVSPQISRRKAVLQCLDSGKIVEEWESLNKAAAETGISKGAISNCCVGRRKHAGGYCWKFKNKN